jgi:F-type H+-transporting ATPase subunit delta
MKKNPGIARLYAKVLYELAVQEKKQDEVVKDLNNLKDMLSDNYELRQSFKNLTLSRKILKKIAVGLSVGANFQRLTQHFLQTLAQHRRLSYLPEIIDVYHDLLLMGRNQVKASILSAQQLSKWQLESITKVLENKVGKSVVLAPEVQPDLLGGIVVRIGDTMLDSSVQNKLMKLQQVLERVA